MLICIFSSLGEKNEFHGFLAGPCYHTSPHFMIQEVNISILVVIEYICSNLPSDPGQLVDHEIDSDPHSESCTTVAF
jgi:hypothetical protein